MRTEKQMMDLILGTAEEQKVRAVILNGSRVDPTVPKDCFQDYDIVYIVEKMAWYQENPHWIDVFGPRIILQTPESNTLPALPPMGDGHISYLMLLEDGNRIDLSLYTLEVYLAKNADEPAVTLLDKDGVLPPFPLPDGSEWYVTRPTAEQFYDCCNEFFWIQQNTAKGIRRDELPYAMQMHNLYARDMLHLMLDWYLGTQHNFQVNPGKAGKYYKRLLSPDLYAQYCDTYAAGGLEQLWEAVFAALALFRRIGLPVAEKLGFGYPEAEDQGMRLYLERVRAGFYG